MRPIYLIVALLIAVIAVPSLAYDLNKWVKTLKLPEVSRIPETLGVPNTRSSFVRVHSITDGDTIQVHPLNDPNATYTVRLVHIDAPELVGMAECHGVQAKRALSKFLTPGAKIRLMSENGVSQQDIYGRYLRYVYANGVNVNLALVRDGHAAPWFYRGQSGNHADKFMSFANAAQTNQKGLWGRCNSPVLDPTKGVNTGAA